MPAHLAVEPDLRLSKLPTPTPVSWSVPPGHGPDDAALERSPCFRHELDCRSHPFIVGERTGVPTHARVNDTTSWAVPVRRELRLPGRKGAQQDRPVRQPRVAGQATRLPGRSADVGRGATTAPRWSLPQGPRAAARQHGPLPVHLTGHDTPLRAPAGGQRREDRLVRRSGSRCRCRTAGGRNRPRCHRGHAGSTRERGWGHPWPVRRSCNAVRAWVMPISRPNSWSAMC